MEATKCVPEVHAGTGANLEKRVAVLKGEFLLQAKPMERRYNHLGSRNLASSVLSISPDSAIRRKTV